MDRRDFLRSTCTFCMAAGTGLLATSLSSCAGPPMLEASVIDHRITVPLSAFVGSDFQIIQPEGFLFDIGLVKGADGKFQAFVLECTHASTQLTPAGDGYTCPEHGSTFDIKGKVTRGPAQLPLRQLQTAVSSDSVTIYLR